MAIKVAINGLGRIGRPVFRKIIERYPNLEIVAVNDLTDNETLAHLLKYDSVYGKYEKKIDFDEKNIYIEGKKIPVFAEMDPEKLPWKELGVDIVVECTGHFRDLEGANKHLEAGAKKVIISAPAKSEEIPSFVLGVNADKFNPNQDKIVDMGSCTTNCLAPIVKIINDNFGIVKGFMTTVHSYTNDQRILDLPHKDLRRARAAALNIIPTTTGAAKAIGKVIPEVNGKLDGIAVRVPSPTVSLLDLIVEVKRNTSKEEVNEVFKKAAKESNFQGIFRVEESPLVSTDFKGEEYSSVLDLDETMVKDNLVKILAWYDNEYGYSSRLADFTDYIGKRMNI